MIWLVFYLFGVVVALGAGVAGAWSDYKGMTIPNALSLIIVAAFALSYTSAQMAGVEIFSDLKAHLAAGLLIFLITFLLFFLKVMGGGDSKLLSVYALWAGFSVLVTFLFYMALFGALIGLAALAIKKYKPFKTAPPESWIGRVQTGKSAIPYGIAITAGAVFAFVERGYFDPETMAQFLL